MRPARTVEGDRLADERCKGGLVNDICLKDVNRPACVAVKARIEETRRVHQSRALGEGQLHLVLVRFARADGAVMRPDWRAGFGGCDPLPLLDHVRVCQQDLLAHAAKRFPAPVCEVCDSFGDEV